jgi:4-hydroxybenzoate polyprenyltransferase
LFKNIIIALRVKHWVKNLFVFIPLLVSGSFFDLNLSYNALLAFLSFCLASSVVYFFNDLMDIEKDKNHPKKKYRPIASGKISITLAIVLIFLMLLAIILLQNISINNIYILIISYLLLNLNYSLWLKKISIIDIMCIATGFVLRVQSGVLSTGLDTSEWLISMTFTLAMLLALGKRKVELKYTSSDITRNSLKGYTIQSINNMQIIFISCTMIFYLLYVNMNTTFTGNFEFLSASSIFVIAGLLRYIQISFSESMDEQPTDILYKDKFILTSVFLWSIIISLSFIF